MVRTYCLTVRSIYVYRLNNHYENEMYVCFIVKHIAEMVDIGVFYIQS